MREIPLAEVADVVRGVTFAKSDAFDAPADDRVPILRAGNISDQINIENDLVFVDGRHVKPDQRLRKDDIVMCTSSGSASVVGKSAILDADWPGSFGAFCATIRTNPRKAVPSFVAHFLRSPLFRNWASGSSGIGIKNIRSSDLKNFTIPFPPLEEQRRIAAILDQADALRRLRHRTLTHLNTLAQSIFHEMFGDPAKNPKGWPTKKVSELCRRVTVGIVVKPASYYCDSGVPAIRGTNIKENRIDLSDIVYFSEDINNTKLAKTRIWENDIIIVRSGRPGLAAIVPPELNGANSIDVLIATPDQNLVSPIFLKDTINSPGGRRIVLSESRGQIQQHFNVGSLSSAEFLIPPMDMQNCYADRVRAIQLKADGFQQANEASERLFTSLQHRAFRGEL